VLAYVVRRLLWSVVLFLAISFCTYIIFFVLPADSTQIGRGSSQAETVDIRDAFEVDGNLFEEYGSFVWNFVAHADLGRSFANRQHVSEMIGRAAPVTISIVVGGAVLWLLIAIPIGVLSALRPRSLLDRVTMTFVLVGMSAHPAWIGFLLAFVFARTLHWLPFSGYCDVINPQTECGGPAAWAYHLILPWITLSLLFAAVYTRMIRATVLETLEEDWVRTARAKGASEWRILHAHVLRGSLLVVVTMLGMDLGLAMVGTVLMGGAVFVERVFSLPGIGNMTLAALPNRDLPVITGVVLFVTSVVVVLNLIVDVLYAWLDPRVRVTSRADGELAEKTAGRAPAGVGAARPTVVSRPTD
jgi:peptide/nickel transport system permease protein